MCVTLLVTGLELVGFWSGVTGRVMGDDVGLWGVMGKKKKKKGALVGELIRWISY